MIRLILLNLAFLAVLAAFILRPQLIVRAEGTTLKTTQASFYIPAQNPTKVYKFDPKAPQLEEIIQANIKDSPATFGIFIKNLNTGQEVSVNPDESFTAASLYKLAIMYTIYELADEGKINLSSPDIKQNLEAMITVSSNEAAIYLVEKYTSWQQVTDYVHSLGLSQTDLNQETPVTTPADMAKLLELITEGRAVNLEASVSMLELMAAQKNNDRIPVYIPPTTIVAHKTGELDDVRHDAGVIITPENNYVLVLMSKGSDNPEAVKPIMAKLSGDIHEFFRAQWANPPEIL